MEESQSFAQNGSAAATRVILQLPPQSRRDGPSGQDVRGHKNHSSQNDPVQQNMKNVMAEQQQEQDSISITSPGTLELQVDHHNYPQYLPGYSQPPFSILGGLASPRCHLGPPGTSIFQKLTVHLSLLLLISIPRIPLVLCFIVKIRKFR
jgi:hypothetical protein